MLLRDLIWRFLSVVFAFSFTQFSIWSNNYTTTRLTETFKPLLGWIKNIDYERPSENAKEIIFSYSCSNNRQGSNNELEINDMHPRLQEKVDVPGIIYQQVSAPPPLSRPPKCTWKQRLGFQFQSSRSPPFAPSVWNFLSVIASHWLDSARSYAKWLRLRLGCSFMRRSVHFIRSYLPWEPNPVMELMAIWTIFAIFIIGLNLYDIIILRSKEQEDGRYDYGQNDSEECKTCMEEKMREIFPQIKLLDEG